MSRPSIRGHVADLVQQIEQQVDASRRLVSMARQTRALAGRQRESSPNRQAILDAQRALAVRGTGDLTRVHLTNCTRG